MSTVQTNAEQAEALARSCGRNRGIKLLFLLSAALSVAAFLTFDYLYSSALQGSVVSGGA